MQIDYLTHAAVGIFAIVLLLLSLYAWTRRRHVGLLLVSSAFLLFALKEGLWFIARVYGFAEMSIADLSVDSVRTLLDLTVLGLFFVAITLRPRKQLE